MESLPWSLGSVAAIEGPSGSGKTTLLRGLAARYDCAAIEIGVIVRALAWWAKHERVSISTAVATLAAADAAGALVLNSTPDTAMAATDLIVRGHAFGPALFASQLGESLTAVTLDQEGMAWVHALVRERLRWRRAAVSGREVAIRTVPGARLIVRLESSTRVRRRRKLEQMSRAGMPGHWQDDAQLLAPPESEALHLDTTCLSPDDVLRQVGLLAESRLGWRPVVDGAAATPRHGAA